MKITKRQTMIELNEEEKEIIGKAIEILTSVMYEIDDSSTLFGYNNADWENIIKGLDEAYEKGMFIIE